MMKMSPKNTSIHEMTYKMWVEREVLCQMPETVLKRTGTGRAKVTLSKSSFSFFFSLKRSEQFGRDAGQCEARASCLAGMEKHVEWKFAGRANRAG